jgi:hypothetical protein
MAVIAAYHRLLHGHSPLTGKFARHVVDVIIDGLQRPWRPENAASADQEAGNGKTRTSARPGALALMAAGILVAAD